ncbi:protein IWS1 homolog 1-like [Mangifera indica]|uniref:protein IWS1 homolog 1-like n=1 Tax=Mangifera indica TaxID=29780 RepID=UPI001CFBD641|nr:protein IWS1 homolog 1-like [Mangifera indica]
MGYEDDPYRDEDGEPLMDYDDMQSDREPSPEPHQNDILDDLEDDIGDFPERERSQTPVYDNEKSKPRKRLVKKVGSIPRSGTPNLVDENDDDEDNFIGDDFGREMEERKRKKWGKEVKESSKRVKVDKERRLGKASGSKSGKKGNMKDSDKMLNEMWNAVAPPGDSEDDQEGVRTVDDDNFIDDSGVDPSDRYGSDNEMRFAHDAPQAEEGDEDEEINELFKMGKKKKKNEKSPAQIALLVENVMAELEVTAEEDAELNRQNKPAINKLKKLSLLIEVLSKKQLQQEFLDHGVLTLLKNWLEPLPDGSLPNINIRAAILKILTDFPIDLEQYDRREQLKKSGLGKVIMFLSKSDEETTSNRKLAKDLVDKWSRPIFNKSTRFEDMKNVDDDRVPFRRPSVKKPTNKSAAMESRDGDFDDLVISRDRKSGQSSSGQQASRQDSATRQHASRPEATPLDFVVRPQSKIDPEEIRARAKQVMHDQRRMKMNKKLQQLKAPKKKQMQATKLSVEGRGMLKYL